MSAIVTAPTIGVPMLPAIPAVTLVTADDFIARYENHRVELVKGVVKELPAPYNEHGYVCATITRLLGNHVDAQKCGRVMSHDSWIRVSSNPDTIRGPDVNYFSFTRLPPGKVPAGILDVLPELVVEVRSPSDTWSAIFAKVGEYLGVGIVVLVIDAETETASIYRTTGQTIFARDQELTLPDVLPGFAVPVARLFA